MQAFSGPRLTPPRPIRFACSTACFRHTSIDSALDEIRKAGFDTIDLAAIPGPCTHFNAARASGRERDDLVRLIRNTGLTTATVTAAPGYFNDPNAGEYFIIQAAVANLKLAAQLGAQAVNLNCGLPVWERGAFHEHTARVVRGLKRLARQGRELGLNLNIEGPGPARLCETLDETELLLDMIGELNVYVVLDPSDILAIRSRPDEAVGRFAGRIGQVRFRDGGGSWSDSTHANNMHLRELFRALAQFGYKNYCSLELDGGDTLEHSRHDLRRLSSQLTVQAGLATAAAAPGLQL